MCGIIGVVQGEDGREPVPVEDLFSAVEGARAALPFQGADAVTAAAAHLERIDGMLRGVRGVVTLAQDAGAAEVLRSFGDEMWRAIASYESRLDTRAETVDDLEDVNATLSRLKDAVWR